MHNFCSYCVKALLREVLSEHAQHAVWPATPEAATPEAAPQAEG